MRSWIGSSMAFTASQHDWQPPVWLPHDQVNAHPDEGLLVRAGIPHRGGRLAAHALNNGYAVLVSAAAFWNRKQRRFQIPSVCDLYGMDWALDSAGFTAVRNWQVHGKQLGTAGVYPWTCAEYIQLVCEARPTWWAAQDLCCEPEVSGSAETVDYRVRATATLLESTLQHVYHCQGQMAKQGWSARAIANTLPPPVPVIQGWSSDSYLKSLELTLQVWERWQPWVGAPKLIGIGSVCRRHLHHPGHGLLAVLGALQAHWPSGGARAHLFGVKGPALTTVKHMEFIASTDSMAYDLAARRGALVEGRSNSFESRQQCMTDWMSRASVHLGRRDAYLSRAP